MKPIILIIILGISIGHVLNIAVERGYNKSVDYGVLVSHGNLPMKTSSGEITQCIMIRNHLSCYYPEQ